MKNWLFAALLPVLLSGCISMEYTGKTMAPVEGKVKIFTDSGKITAPYDVLGTATVSGNYQDVSRDRMIDKLRTEAGKCGANAILIVEQQVLTDDNAVPGNSVFVTAFDYDDTDSNWRYLYRDVDRNFANSRRNRTSTTAGSANHFRRIIRAEFIRYKNQAQPDVKK